MSEKHIFAFVFQRFIVREGVISVHGIANANLHANALDVMVGSLSSAP